MMSCLKIMDLFISTSIELTKPSSTTSQLNINKFTWLFNYDSSILKGGVQHYASFVCIAASVFLNNLRRNLAREKTTLATLYRLFCYN